MSAALRARLRRFRLGAATLLGSRRGWFIPYRYAASVAPPTGYRALEPHFALARPFFIAQLRAAEAQLAALGRFGGAPPAPRFEQDWFPRLDLAVAYTLVRDRRPRRIVEIGSGHSTRALARAIADGALPTRLVAIDPQPRADLAGLQLELVRATLQQAPRDIIATLEPGDMLIVDSSHVLMPGSDVDLLLNDVLPSLPAGALVHFHDIFLPDGYPADWEWRGYNEQGAIGALLPAAGWRLLWGSHYVATRLADELAASALASLPLPPGARESSLWLERL